ncbi:MAG: exodeoxyribonuclease VII small subunit [Desulfobacteraceae bacterium]|nr:exodeoxyribonuclease VII small subunit [Desulfobacteraceae bacterium]
MAKKKTFEESMKQLEQIVKELEDGDLPLEEALKKFEEGVALSKFCSQKLDETEKKVSILLKEPNGRISETPFLSGDALVKEED